MKQINLTNYNEHEPEELAGMLSTKQAVLMELSEIGLNIIMDYIIKGIERRRNLKSRITEVEFVMTELEKRIAIIETKLLIL